MRRWNDPAWLLLPVVLAMIVSVLVGFLEPLNGKGAYTDCKTVSECYAIASDALDLE